jgi:hypothetical protein
MKSKILLRIYKDDKKIRKLRLEQGEFTLGRDQACDIIVKEE